MKPILSGKFNMDTACVERKFLDGTIGRQLNLIIPGQKRK